MKHFTSYLLLVIALLVSNLHSEASALKITTNSIVLPIAGCNADNSSVQTTNSSYEYISNVTLDGTPNASGNPGNGYTDFTGSLYFPDLMQGTSVNISINKAWPGSSYNDAVAVWIDFDRSGTYEASEKVFNSAPNTTTPVNGSITIPVTAVPGNTTMRVFLTDTSLDTTATPCESTGRIYGETEDYTINIIAATCNANTPSNVIASNLEANESTINWDALPLATYDLRYREDGTATWTDINDLTTNNYTLTGLIPNTTYNVEVRSKCNATDISSYASINFTTTSINYCNVTAGNGTYFYISKVSLDGTSNNSTSSTTGYSDYTALSIFPDIITGSSSTIEVEKTYTSSVYNVGIGAWIDFNGDGDFDDPNEHILDTPPSSTSPVTNTFTIPATALVGNKRMRIALKYNASATPCDTSNTYGEFEDYTVNVLPPLPEIAVLGNTIEIPDGSTVTDTNNFTDFGISGAGTGIGITHAFTIRNSGLVDLILTDPSPYISISDAINYTINIIPNSTITPSGSTLFSIEFNPTTVGVKDAIVTINNNDANESVYTFKITGEGVTPVPEILISGAGNEIVNGDSAPTLSDNTDFGDIGTGLTTSKIFTIENTGTGTLNLTGSSPYVAISGDPDFTVTITPSNTINPSSATTFTITFSPTTGGTKTATVTVINNDADEGTYTFTITGVGVPPVPEIRILGNSNEIANGTTATGAATNTNFGNVALASQVDKQFIIENIGAGDLLVTNVILSNNTDFFVSLMPDDTIIPSEFSMFFIAFKPSSLGPKSTTVTVQNNDGDESNYSFTITGNCVASYTEAPGGVVDDLHLWLKGGQGLPTTDGAAVSRWETQASGTDATVNTPGQEPTFKDNLTDNFNFNPVVDFDNTVDNILDSDFSFDDTNTQFLEGAGGFYTHDMFVVVKPDVPVSSATNRMYVFCGDEDFGFNSADPTGIGFGNSTIRFKDEVITYNFGPSSTTFPYPGYGVSDAGSGDTYDGIGIINTRNNASLTGQELYYNGNNIGTAENDLSDFGNVNNSRFWIGRCEAAEANTDGKIAEIITYSLRKDDATQRNKIMSYLAIKYGITLGVNGTSKDYVDSSGSFIWDTSSSSGFGYNIAGIGRDDNAALDQRQSKSINSLYDSEGETLSVLTIGVNDIYDTNSQNITAHAPSLPDRSYLLWGDNNAPLTADPYDVIVDLSSGITGVTTPVSFTRMQRVWKVVERGGDVPKVKIRIPRSAVRSITPPGSYFMFVSNSPTFDSTASYSVMTPEGSDMLETSYDFDNTKYITFGYAPEVRRKRSIDFDGVDDYVDMDDVLNLNPSGFTISAWVKVNSPTSTMSIASKRDFAYTDGYDFRVNTSRQLEMTWGASGIHSITSSTALTNNVWHHVSAIYTSSGNITLYIDGIEDASSNLVVPNTTNYRFRLAAAGKNTVTEFFRGNIDEVRVWNTALSVDQLRFIMNQEIRDDASKVTGKELIAATKNDINTIDWSLLAGYYPMESFVYTNINDQSGNNNIGALRNLNTVVNQTAPIPYESNSSGNWDDTTTWLNGDKQTIPGTRSIVNSNTTIDWNIVKINNNITMNNTNLLTPTPTILNPTNMKTRTLLGLIVESGELNIERKATSNPSDIGSGLKVTHYLKLDGKIDLDGESQLVQTEGSDLDPTSSGTLEKDQQGTYNLYTYNHWSSPVGVSNSSSNNNNYTVADVLRDGTDPDNPQNITFIGGGNRNGTSGSPIGIAEYWIWKYSNLDGSYPAWQHAQSTGTLLAGEGFTMKGVDGSIGSESSEQNYAFVGKPNNGNIDLPITGGNSYLVGNPYPSAINAQKFINDNPETTGSLYFWEHWGGGSHILSEYQGGYAVYSSSGGAPATAHPDVNNTGTPSKIPEAAIPVSQGFFVQANSGGTIKFRNSQRELTKEVIGQSTFIRQAQGNTSEHNTFDTRLKLRLGLTSPKKYKAQLLLTVDSNASMEVDWSYDALEFGNYPENMYWMIENEEYKIQGINEIAKNTILPLGLHTKDDGICSFKIDRLVNAPKDMNIYMHDKDTDIYHDLELGTFDIFLNAGKYTERFEITFSKTPQLDVSENVTTSINTYYNNANHMIVVNNPELKPIESIKLINILGQEIFHTNTIEVSTYIEIESDKLSDGIYTIELKSENTTFTKKILVK